MPGPELCIDLVVYAVFAARVFSTFTVCAEYVFIVYAVSVAPDSTLHTE